MSRFQTIPKYYQAEPLPIVQNLAFPPFKLEHRYKGVYERAGFDVLSPDGPRRPYASRSRQGSQTSLATSEPRNEFYGSHMLGSLLAHSLGQSHHSLRHAKSDLETTLPDREPDIRGVGNNNVKGLQISTGVELKQPYRGRVSNPTLPRINQGATNYQQSALVPPIRKAHAPSLPNYSAANSSSVTSPTVAMSQKPPFHMGTGETLSLTSDQPSNASFTFGANSIASSQKTESPELKGYQENICAPQVYPDSYHDVSSELKAREHDNNVQMLANHHYASLPQGNGVTMEYGSQHVQNPQSPTSHFPTGGQAAPFVPITKKMKQRQSQEQMERRQTLTRKKSLKKINQIDLALNGLRGDVELHRLLLLLAPLHSSIIAGVPRFSYQNAPMPITQPHEPGSDRLHGSTSTTDHSTLDYQQFLSTEPQSDKYRQLQILMVLLIILRQLDLSVDEDEDDVVAAELQRQLALLKILAGSNLQIESPNTRRKTLIKLARENDIDVDAIMMLSPDQTPKVSPCKSKIMTPGITIDQTDVSKSHVSPQVPGIIVEDTSSDNQKKSAHSQLETPQKPKKHVSVMTPPTQAVEAPKYSPCALVEDLEQLIDRSISELELTLKNSSMLRLSSTTDDFADMLSTASYELVQPLFVKPEGDTSHPEVKFVQLPQLPSTYAMDSIDEYSGINPFYSDDLNSGFGASRSPTNGQAFQNPGIHDINRKTTQSLLNSSENGVPIGSGPGVIPKKLILKKTTYVPPSVDDKPWEPISLAKVKVDNASETTLETSRLQRVGLFSYQLDAYPEYARQSSALRTPNSYIIPLETLDLSNPYPTADLGDQGSPLLPLPDNTPPGHGPCRSCLQEILPGSRGSQKPIFAILGELSGQWHRGCFRCTYESCSVVFSREVQCYVFADAPYCQFHYHMVNNTVCEMCATGIEGECIENELLQKWHLHCLRCLKCTRNIKEDYYLINGDIYCERDGGDIIQGVSSIDNDGNYRGLNHNDRVERRRTRLLFVDGQTL